MFGRLRKLNEYFPSDQRMILVKDPSKYKTNEFSEKFTKVYWYDFWFHFETNL